MSRLLKAKLYALVAILIAFALTCLLHPAGASFPPLSN